MIILAAAIILSLSNNGIIGKADKAKIDSDTASLKEYVNTLRAEYELMTADERNRKTFEAYANAKLEENGYKGAAIDVDGKVHSNLTESAKTAIKAGIKVGDKVEGYILTEKSYTTSGEENSYDPSNNIEMNPQTVAANTTLTWKYLGVNTNGELEIMADLGTTAVADNTKVTLSGKGGYLKGPDMLNTVCKELYSVSGVGTARSMNIDDVNNLLGYIPTYNYTYSSSTITSAIPLTIGETENKLNKRIGARTTPDGKDLETYYADCYVISKTSSAISKGKVSLIYNEKNEYWLASPCVDIDLDSDYAFFLVRHVGSTYVNSLTTFMSDGSSSNIICAVRPVVKLDTSVKLTKDATVANTWNISK